MAQLQQYVVTQTGKKNVPNCPTFTIAGLVYNDAGVQVADFTGANALVFPNMLTGMTQPQVDKLTDLIANWLILTAAGLNP
jgi:hypothetical protein